MSAYLINDRNPLYQCRFLDKNSKKKKEELEGDFYKTYTPDKRLRAVFDFIVCMQELDMFLNNCVGVLVSVLYPKW